MKTLKIGIAGYDRMKARTIAIARGERKPARDEPKVWFTSVESFAKVLSHRNRELLTLIAREEPQSPYRTGRALRAKQVEPVAHSEDDVALRSCRTEDRKARPPWCPACPTTR